MRRVEISGDKEIVAELKRLEKVYPNAVGSAIYKLGVAIISDALPRTPVEYAPLRTSHYVSPPMRDKEKSNVELGYGTVYAVAQHENRSFRHPRGGEAKYLEKAVRSVSPRALKLLAQWTEEAARGGGFASTAGMPTRPRVSNSNRKKKSQSARLARAARNVKRRTGR